MKSKTALAEKTTKSKTSKTKSKTNKTSKPKTVKTAAVKELGIGMDSLTNPLRASYLSALLRGQKSDPECMRRLTVEECKSLMSALEKRDTKGEDVTVFVAFIHTTGSNPSEVRQASRPFARLWTFTLPTDEVSPKTVRTFVKAHSPIKRGYVHICAVGGQKTEYAEFASLASRK